MLWWVSFFWVLGTASELGVVRQQYLVSLVPVMYPDKLRCPQTIRRLPHWVTGCPLSKYPPRPDLNRTQPRHQLAKSDPTCTKISRSLNPRALKTDLWLSACTSFRPRTNCAFVSSKRPTCPLKTWRALRIHMSKCSCCQKPKLNIKPRLDHKITHNIITDIVSDSRGGFRIFSRGGRIFKKNYGNFDDLFFRLT